MRIDRRLMSPPSSERWPAIGLGTWRMGEGARARSAEVRAVRHALDIGYRLIDTAEMYGDGGAEQIVGVALAQAFRSGLDRSSVTLVTKVYPHNASRAGVQAACDRSRKRLGLDRIDLYLLHWRGDVPLLETSDGFEVLCANGHIRHWGVSNFDVGDLEELEALGATERCQTNQVCYSLASRGIEFDLLPWMCGRNMPLMAYSPIGQGALVDRSVLLPLSQRLGVSAAQLALAWVIRHDNVIAIPKAVQPAHLQANFEAAALRLDDAALMELDRAFPPPRRKLPLAMT